VLSFVKYIILIGSPGKVMFKSSIYFVLVLVSLLGCSSQLIKAKEGADLIKLVEQSDTTGCEGKGSVTVSVLTKLGFFTRSVESVEENLIQLARNSAVDVGGNTIVKGELLEFGKRSFLVFQCKH
jgi:hypothetical protein